MKRILFYTLIGAQLIIILVLTYEFNQIDMNGQQIKLQTIKPEYPIAHSHFDGSLPVDYEINEIQKHLWENNDSLDYNDRVYGLLESDENGIYHVQKASTTKLTTKKDNQIVLAGTYAHEDADNHFHYVDFGLKSIDNLEQFGSIPEKASLVMTVQIGKWGQHKITGIDQAE